MAFLWREAGAASAFVFGAEGGDLSTGDVDDDASDVGGLLRGRARFEVEPAREARDEIAALRVHHEIDRVDEERERLGGGGNVFRHR